MRTLRVLGCVAALTVGAFAQTTSTISISGNAFLTGGTGYGLNGTTTITGLGTAILSGSGQIDNSLLTGQSSGSIPGTLR